MNKAIRSFVFCTSLFTTATALAGVALPWKNQLVTLFNRSEESQEQVSNENLRQPENPNSKIIYSSKYECRTQAYNSPCKHSCKKPKKVFDPELLKKPVERHTPECERLLAQTEPDTEMVGNDFMFWKFV